MEFFDWMGIPQFFLDFIGVECVTQQEVVDTLKMQLFICIGVAAGLFVIGQIFCGLGLYTLAKRMGYRHPWLGFIPIACTWLSGKLAGEAHFFGQKMKRAGLYASIAEGIYIALQILILVLNFLTFDPAFYLYEGTASNGAWKLNLAAMGNLRWVGSAIFYLEMVNYVVWFLLAVLFFVLYTAFFRKYYARNPFLMTFLCVIVPARGFVIFAVRNNRPVDYQEYTRRRMEEYARRNNPYGYGGGYGGGGYEGGYGGGNGGGNGAPQEPFSDFGGRGQSQDGQSGSGGQSGPDDPFSDF